MWNRRAAFLLGFLMAVSTVTSAGGDEEGCLFCHRLGIVRTLPDRVVSLRVWDPPGGIHAILYCSDCHPDAKNAPHTLPPGPARCIGECHGSTGQAMESHRRAAFGGLTEIHRPAAAPYSPCRICHGAGDPPGDVRRIVERCGRCHGPEAESLSRGIHARTPRANACVGCHPPHRESHDEPQQVSCEGGDCHPSASERKIRLAGHDVRGAGTGTGGPIARGGLFLLIVLGGWGAGRVFSVRAPRKGVRE